MIYWMITCRSYELIVHLLFCFLMLNILAVLPMHQITVRWSSSWQPIEVRWRVIMCVNLSWTFTLFCLC